MSAEKDLVLLGGGHSHALVLRMLAMAPIKGARLTLVSPDPLTPYSGMLPGQVAGYYRREQTHIDLARLCQWAGVRFVRAAATHLDADDQQLTLSDGSRLNYDWLSIDIGSRPDSADTPGAQAHAVAVKPVASFSDRWDALLSTLSPGDTPSIAVVGAGAGGTEMALAIEQACRRRGINAAIHLLSSGELLPGYSIRVRKRMTSHLQAAGITLHTNRTVVSVSEGELELSDGALSADMVLWCTGARAHPLTRDSALQTDARGFVTVDATLRSLSHANVFAAGDCAHFSPAPLAKAGVFAVRQAGTLAHNLRAVIEGGALQAYAPQRRFLSLLSAGNQQAVGNRFAQWLPGTVVWQLKDWIDRRFMQRFETLPAPGMTVEQPPMRCAGCGAKVGPDALSSALDALAPVDHDDIVRGLAAREDGTAIAWPAGKWLVQNQDFFPAFIDEPALLGRIAVLHSLSDLYAMNATPHSALATVTLPFNHPRLQGRDLARLMTAAVDELNAAGCALIGGHTLEGVQMAAGFTVNGSASPDTLFEKRLAQSGDMLVLTKPIGTGVILAAHQQLLATGDDLHAALAQMLTSNRQAADILARLGVRCCTDVTGFGLLGHLLEICQASQLCATLDGDRIPLLDGALSLAARGVSSTLKPGNDAALARCAVASRLQTHPLLTLLTDPQTSGGLLAAVPPDQLDTCLAIMAEHFIPAAVVGKMLAREVQDATIAIH